MGIFFSKSKQKKSIYKESDLGKDATGQIVHNYNITIASQDNKVTFDKNFDNIKIYKENNCEKKNKSNTCNITENDIYNITFFLSYVLPKCQIEGVGSTITLKNIKDSGKIIGKGSYGYTFSVETNKKYVIKITIANENDKKNKLKEYEILKKLNELNGNIFIKLYGYYHQTEEKKYEYIRYNNKLKIECKPENKLYDKESISNNNVKNDKISRDYNIYGIMEGAEGNLTQLKKINFEKFNNLFEEFIKISTNQENIFIHNDIKPENIVYFKDGTLKLIDFGVSKFSETFFYKNDTITPKYLLILYKLKYEEKSLETLNKLNHYTSPFYDIFCLCVSFLITLNNNNSDIFFNKNNEYIFDNNIQNLSKTYKNDKGILKYIKIIIFIQDMYQTISELKEKKDIKLENIIKEMKQNKLYEKPHYNTAGNEYYAYTNIMEQLIN